MESKERRYVVAIADDDQRVLQSLGNLLESADYSVRLFNSAEAFLQDDAVHDIDALVSDIRMPGVDGVELQRLVGLQRPQLPVILITACRDVDIPKIQPPNNRGVFSKPIDPAEFLKTLGAAVKGKA
jgi:FixJ family two-component response regulator